MTKKNIIVPTVVLGFALLISTPTFAHSSPNQGNSQMNLPGHNQSMMQQGGSMMMSGVDGMDNTPCKALSSGRNFSSADITTLLEARLIWAGHKRLTVGSVSESEDGFFIADINTKDGSLVWRIEVDPKNGQMQHIE